jgi:hypothetical protein
MSHVNRSRWYLLAPIVLVSSVGLIAASRPTRALRPCEVVAKWVAAHKAELPTTLAEFARFSKAYQRSIYASLPAAVRMSIWREHLTPYLAPAAGLNEAQRALVQHVLDELDVLVTDPTGQRGRDQRTKENLIAKLQAAFSRTQTMEIFTLNTVTSIESASREGSSGEVEESGASAAVSNSSTGFECECSIDQSGVWDCDANLGCVDDGQCFPITSCGIIWEDDCDGVCRMTEAK